MPEQPNLQHPDGTVCTHHPLTPTDTRDGARKKLREAA